MFVSSSIPELSHIRIAVRDALFGTEKFEPVLFEGLGATPQQPLDLCLRLVRESDVYIGMFDTEYSWATEQEYWEANFAGKPCFVYCSTRNDDRQKRLHEFLRKQLKNEVYLLIDFSKIENLTKHIIQDIEEWLVRAATQRVSTPGGISDKINQLSSGLYERLHCNLLPVVRIPQVVYSVPQKEGIPFTLWNQVKMEAPDAFITRSRSVFSLSDLSSSKALLSEYCDFSKIATHRIHHLLASHLDWTHWQIELLNQNITKYCGSLGLRIDPMEHIVFFESKDGEEVRCKYKTYTERTEERAVVKKFFNLKTLSVSNYRNSAARLSFKRIDGSIYLIILPTYTFTQDGHTLLDSKRRGRLVSKMKRLEFNSQVFNHLYFWSEFLSKGNNLISLPVTSDKISIKKSYFAFSTSFGIHEDKPKSVVTSEEPEEDIQETEELDEAELEQDGD